MYDAFCIIVRENTIISSKNRLVYTKKEIGYPGLDGSGKMRLGGGVGSSLPKKTDYSRLQPTTSRVLGGLLFLCSCYFPSSPTLHNNIGMRGSFACDPAVQR